MNRPPQHQVSLPNGTCFTASEDQTVLQAALQAGVRWESSCRNGTCRTCIGQLEAGHVRYAIAWPGLSPEEKASGAVLPCVAHAMSDLQLRFVGL